MLVYFVDLGKSQTFKILYIETISPRFNTQITYSMTTDMQQSMLKTIVLSNAEKISCFLRNQPSSPFGTDLIGYNIIISFIKDRHVFQVEGDLVEIGTFLGGGALKLSKTIEREAPKKTLFVIDVFDPNFDWTKNTSGNSMASFYQDSLKRYHGRTQQQVYEEVTSGRKNIVTLKIDSKKAHLPTDKLCFALIDGNHSPDYVESDFLLVWALLKSGGVVAFHDYEGDLPQTTMKINELINRYKKEIVSTHQIKSKWLIFLVKA